MPGYLVKYKFIEISRADPDEHLSSSSTLSWRDSNMTRSFGCGHRSPGHWVHKKQWVVHCSMLQHRKIAHLIICPPLIGIHHRAGQNVLVDEKGGVFLLSTIFQNTSHVTSRCNSHTVVCNLIATFFSISFESHIGGYYSLHWIL